jgi:hypothetical protein
MTLLEKIRAFAKTTGPGGYTVGVLEAREIAAEVERLTRERDTLVGFLNDFKSSLSEQTVRALAAERALDEARGALRAIKVASDTLHATKRAPGLQPFFVSDELDDAIEAGAALAEEVKP